LECLKLADLLLNTISHLINAFRGTCNSFQVVAKNSKELLKNYARSIEVLKYEFHMLGLSLNLFDPWEIPTANSHFSLNVHFSFGKLVLPFIKDCDTLLDYRNRLRWRLFENYLELDVIAHFSTDFIGN